MTITSVTVITTPNPSVMVVMVVTVIPYCFTPPKNNHACRCGCHCPAKGVGGVNLYGPSAAMRAPAQIFARAK